MSLDLLGVDFQVVSGYDGGGAERVAFEQGEVNILGDSAPSYLEEVVPLVEAGEAVPVFSLGFPGEDGEVVRDPAVPDLPHVGEVYEMIHGEPPSGEMWDAYQLLVKSAYSIQKILWINGDAPAGAIEALQEAVAEVVEDPAYTDGVDDALGGYDVVIGEELETLLADITDPDQELVQWLQDYTAALEN
jgi:hypothetical protein